MKYKPYTPKSGEEFYFKFKNGETILFRFWKANNKNDRYIFYLPELKKYNVMTLYRFWQLYAENLVKDFSRGNGPAKPIKVLRSDLDEEIEDAKEKNQYIEFLSRLNALSESEEKIISDKLHFFVIDLKNKLSRMIVNDNVTLDEFLDVNSKMLKIETLRKKAFI